MTETKPVTRCGTYAGWSAHKRRAEQPCGDCRAANAGYITALRQRRRFQLRDIRHGTEQALVQHWAWDETPCGLCQSWQRAYLHGLAQEGKR